MNNHGHEPLKLETVTADLATALVALLRRHSVDTDANALLSGLPISGNALPEYLADRAARRVGYSARWLPSQDLTQIRTPCALSVNDGGYVTAVDQIEEGWVVLDPSTHNSCLIISHDDLRAAYSGKTLFLFPLIDTLLTKHSGPKSVKHWFWSRVLERKSRIFEIVLSSFFANLLAVFVSLFALQVYDRVIPGQSEATLWVLVCGVAIAVVFEASIRIARSKLIDQTGKESELQITYELFEKLLGMRADKRAAPPGALVHLIREFASVREFFTTASIGVAADIPFVFIFLFLIYGIAGPVVWIIVAGALLTIAPSLMLQGKMARLSKENLGGMSSASRLLTEASYGLETVKSTQSKSWLQRNWEEITTLNAIKTTEQRELSAFLTFWATAMQQYTYVAAVVGGVYMVFSGDFTTGSIIAVSILSTRTLSPVTQLSGVLSRWQNMQTSLGALEAVMGSEQDRDPKRIYLRRPRLAGNMSFRSVAFSHSGSEQVNLKIDSLDIKAGTRLAILGENGSGKSTLLKLSSGIFHASDGELTIDGVDIRQIDPIDLRKNIGYLPQEVKLFRGTLRENIASGSHQYSDDEVYEGLSFGGLEKYVKSHPKGLDLDIADGGEGLSIGQRQSLGLARLYLQDPSIVILDEPTAALDQKLEQDIVGRLDKWLGTRTCLIATHRMPILSIVSRVAVMQGGRLALEGERDAIIRRLSGGS